MEDEIERTWERLLLDMALIRYPSCGLKDLPSSCMRLLACQQGDQANNENRKFRASNGLTDNNRKITHLQISNEGLIVMFEQHMPMVYPPFMADHMEWFREPQNGERPVRESPNNPEKIALKFVHKMIYGLDLDPKRCRSRITTSYFTSFIPR